MIAPVPKAGALRRLSGMGPREDVAQVRLGWRPVSRRGGLLYEQLTATVGSSTIPDGPLVSRS